FISNTLNNIYSFAIQQHPETPNLIHGLSTFLDYTLYTAKQDRVALETELEYIRNYMELEKIRTAHRRDIAMNIHTPINGFYIGPMIILPFIENAFKHGVSQDTDDSWIRIDVSVEKGQLKMKIENSCPDSSLVNGRAPRSGIGLQNVKRRLEILYGPSHRIGLSKSGGAFLVLLELPNLAA